MTSTDTDKPFETSDVDGVKVTTVHGRMCNGDLSLIKLPAEIARNTRPGSQFLLNLTEAGQIDSTGLGTIVLAMGVAHGRGADFKICGVSKGLGKMLEKTHLDTVLPITATPDDAFVAFKALKEVLPGTAGPAAAGQELS